MRVWQVYLITGVPSVNGVAVVANRLSVALADRGVDLAVFLLDDGGVTPGVFVGSSRRGELVVAPDVGAIEREWQLRFRAGDVPDVVHFHEPFRPPHARLARRLRPRGIPYVVSTHSALAPANLARKRWAKQAYGIAVGRPHLRAAGMIVANTDREADDVRRHLGASAPPVAVIPNSLDESWLGAARWEELDRGRRRVVTLCRYDVHQKGLDTLAAIAAELPAVEVVVHGEADRNDPAKLAALRRSAPPNFVLAPPVRGSATRAALASADLFVQPSRWEGMSASLTEAMAFGMPCAVSATVGETMSFGRLDLGLVLEADPAAAARQIATALDDPARRRRWADRAATHARASFRPEAVANAHITAYEQVRTAMTGLAS